MIFSTYTSLCWKRAIPSIKDDDDAHDLSEAETLDSRRNLLPGHKVLIVEDNYLIALEFQSALQEAGYLAENIVVTAEEAIEACLIAKPHFVMMDVRLLGQRDGIDAAAEIYFRFGVRSLFVTANDDADLRKRATAARPFGWVAKPTTGEQLVAALKAMAVETVS